MDDETQIARLFRRHGDVVAPDHLGGVVADGLREQLEAYLVLARAGESGSARLAAPQTWSSSRASVRGSMATTLSWVRETSASSES
jgi:hypothetical protein